MDIKELITSAMKKGRKALDENMSKQALSHYGIPIVEEIVAGTIDEAVQSAEKKGYPLVLKGMGSDLLHKTEMGLVHLNLKNKEAVRTAAQEISEGAGEKLEGFLLQPYVLGKREFVAGLFRDPLFGPVIMFGLGGVYTEALADVTFRVGPIDEREAASMLDEVKSKSLLGSFRDEAQANRELLVQSLVGLSRIGSDYPEIAEVDINPLIITRKGDVYAVDALITLSDKQMEKNDILPVLEPNFLDEFFSPKSIAFVGASPTIGKWGHLVVVQTISGGYKGDIFLVNPKGEDIGGRKVYKNVGEIEGNIDLAVVTIPAKFVRDSIPLLKAKNTRAMLVISSGFGETGDEGKKAERELIAAARDAGIKVFGPNTMGFCNPHNNLFCWGSGARPGAGSTAVIAQSGNMGVQLLTFAEYQGIGIRGFCGSGNEAMITIEDYLTAFGDDPLTKNILVYGEGVKNGRRFMEVARNVSRKKPIILLKGGQSIEGSKAAASHTGALTTDSHIFDTACRQSGVIKVDYVTDLLDSAASFSSLPRPTGNRAGILTLGGGWGVVTADLCERYGLAIPRLSGNLIKAFDGILPSFWNRANPVDFVAGRSTNVPLLIIEEMLKWDECDMVIHLGFIGRKLFIKRLADYVKQVDPSYSSDLVTEMKSEAEAYQKDFLKQIAFLMEKYEKPVIGVKLVADDGDQVVYPVEGCRYDCVNFPAMERAVKALMRMSSYNRFVG